MVCCLAVAVTVWVRQADQLIEHDRRDRANRWLGKSELIFEAINFLAQFRQQDRRFIFPALADFVAGDAKGFPVAIWVKNRATKLTLNAVIHGGTQTKTGAHGADEWHFW